jgi:hypothetical protein
MNNPFGLPDDLFGAILASAIAEGMNSANNRTMKKPNPEASKRNTTPEDGAKAAKKIYDSYVAAGFNEVQAFELLKLVLSK